MGPKNDESISVVCMYRTHTRTIVFLTAQKRKKKTTKKKTYELILGPHMVAVQTDIIKPTVQISLFIFQLIKSLIHRPLTHP